MIDPFSGKASYSLLQTAIFRSPPPLMWRYLVAITSFSPVNPSPPLLPSLISTESFLSPGGRLKVFPLMFFRDRKGSLNEGKYFPPSLDFTFFREDRRSLPDPPLQVEHDPSEMDTDFNPSHKVRPRRASPFLFFSPEVPQGLG